MLPFNQKLLLLRKPTCVNNIYINRLTPLFAYKNVKAYIRIFLTLE